MIRGVLAAAAVVVLASCGSAQPTPTVVTVTATAPASSSTPAAETSPTPDCNIEYKLLTKDELETVLTGLEFESDARNFKVGVKIPLGDEADLTYTKLVVVYDENNTPMELAAGELNGGTLGPIVAVDDLARATFRWGSAADDGTPVGRFRSNLAESDLVARVDQCGPPGT